MTRVRALIVVFLLIAAAAGAQDFFRGYGRGYNRVPPRFPTPDSYDGAFNFCRGMFTSVRRSRCAARMITQREDVAITEITFGAPIDQRLLDLP